MAVAKKKKTIYDTVQSVMESLFFKLHDRKAAFLYAGIKTPDDGNDYYMLGTSSDDKFRKNDPEFAIYILQITDNEIKEKVRKFFNDLKLDLDELIVINMKDVAALLNKVKWETDKLELSYKNNIGYFYNGTTQKECIRYYDHYCTNLRLNALFDLYVKIFNTEKNNIVLNRFEYNEFDKVNVAHINLSHAGILKRIPIVAGLDNLNVKNIPTEDISFSGFICWKTPGNSFYTGYLCETDKFKSFITRSDIVIF